MSLTDHYLNDAVKKFGFGKSESWPLSATQVLPYFDVDQSRLFYEAIMWLKKTGYSAKEIGKIIKHPTILKYFLNQSGIIGLKLGKELGLNDITIKERSEYIEFLLEVLKSMVHNDPFCTDGKNLTYSETEIIKMVEDLVLINIEDNRRIFAEISVDMFHYAWSLFYNLFASCGFEISGPYEIEIEKKKYILVVRENYNINPKEIIDTSLEFNEIKYFMFFDPNTEYRLSFNNQPISDSYIDNLLKIGVSVDGVALSSLEEVVSISRRLGNKALEISKYVNSLSKIEQMKRGARISFYSLRGIFETAKIHYDSDEIVNKLLLQKGEQFFENKDKINKRNLEDSLKLFDPRNDFLGDVINKKSKDS